MIRYNGGGDQFDWMGGGLIWIGWMDGWSTDRQRDSLGGEMTDGSINNT